MANNSSFENGNLETVAEVPAITWNKILTGTVLYVITLATILGNVLVLIAVKVNKRLQTTFNYYIVNLAITDIAVGVTAMSFQATHTFLGYWPFGEIFCGLWIFFDYGMTFVSVFTLILISGDRFWSVAWSVHYRQHHTKKKCLMSILLAWIFMLLLWFPPCMMDRIRYSEPGICFWDPSLNKEFVFIIAALGHHGPYFLMMFFYTYVFMFMRKRVKVGDTFGGKGGGNTGSSIGARSTVSTSLPSTAQAPPTAITTKVRPVRPDVNSSSISNSHVTVNVLKPPRNPHAPQNTVSSDQNEESRQRRETKVFITLTYIIVGYGVLWLPFHVVFDISIVDPSLVPEPVLNMAFWMAYVNSTINPLLYNVSNVEFRKTFKQLLLGKCCT